VGIERGAKELALENGRALFDTPQHTTRIMSAGKSTGVRQSCLPVAASIATVHLTLVTYITPLWTSGCPCSPYSFSSESVHTGTSRLTLRVLI
jgi:hypothetical protein